MQKRLLYEFPHSHFCEKARWALDYKGLDFRRVPLLPPWHMLVTRRYGKRSSVPLLLDGGRAVQGSAEIIDYLETRYPERALVPAGLSEAERKSLFTREKKIDRDLGVPLRAFFYYYSLHHRPFIAQAFLQNSPFWQRPLFHLQYPVVAALIKRSYCPDQASADQAGEATLRNLDALALELNGKEYLHGDTFSRLDLAAASLLSFVALPPELPVVWPELPDDLFLRGWHQRLSDHPVSHWVRSLYQKHRRPALSGQEPGDA
jgi:glutathione S-transferase